MPVNEKWKLSKASRFINFGILAFFDVHRFFFHVNHFQKSAQHESEKKRQKKESRKKKIRNKIKKKQTKRNKNSI